MDKQKLRATLKTERFKLRKEEVQEKSARIVARAIELIDWKNIRNVHCFTTLPELNEVNTKELFDYIWKYHPHINTFTAVKVGKDWRTGKAVRGMFTERISPLPKLDIIFVPMLGFDKKLNRLGYGAGFYDRFLATQPKARKIGLCFENGRIEKLPAEPHDIPMNKIVTEYKTL